MSGWGEAQGPGEVELLTRESDRLAAEVAKDEEIIVDLRQRLGALTVELAEITADRDQQRLIAEELGVEVERQRMAVDAVGGELASALEAFGVVVRKSMRLAVEVDEARRALRRRSGYLVTALRQRRLYRAHADVLAGEVDNAQRQVVWEGRHDALVALGRYESQRTPR